MDKCLNDFLDHKCLSVSLSFGALPSSIFLRPYLYQVQLQLISVKKIAKAIPGSQQQEKLYAFDNSFIQPPNRKPNNIPMFIPVE